MESSTRIDAGGWLNLAKSRLDQSENPGLEARLLLAHVLAQPVASVLAHPEKSITSAQLDELDDLLEQLRAGVPLPYLLGEQEFFGLKFKVTPAVLIPRPETELLVDAALDWLWKHPARRRAADVGTGSGCIAAAMTAHIPDLKVLACDRSRAALEIARQNFGLHGLQDRIRMVQGDLLTGCAGPFDLVCANLPYIPSSTLRGLAVAKYEPAAALDGGADGLDFICRLLADARRWISPGGLLLLEIEAGQGKSAPTLAKRYFGDEQISLLNDLAGKPRLLSIQA